MKTNSMWLIIAISSVMGVIPMAYAFEEFRGTQYEINSECDFMVINHKLAPAYDPRQVQSLMLFDAGRCDPINPPDLTDCPYYVITEYGFCDLEN